VPGLTFLAAVTPDNTPHGYNLTFAAPMALFIVVAVILYRLFSRPHRRIPAGQPPRPAGQSAAVAQQPRHSAGPAAEPGAGSAAEPGSVSAQSGGPADAGQPGRAGPATDGTEARE
jgi:hypothetical protein